MLTDKQAARLRELFASDAYVEDEDEAAGGTTSA
jgi:hypothetical protein